MNELERQVLREIEDRLEAARQAVAQATWEQRREAASGLFEVIHSAWWRRHASVPGAHAADIERLNEILGLEGEEAQLATTDDGEILPPKFFGGDPRELDKAFVLSVTLNHATPKTKKFRRELKDFQRRDTCWRAHAGYFRQDYVHRVFFWPREKVLSAFAGALREPARPPGAVTDPNRSRALYLEVLPTFSRRFGRERITADERAALAELFTMRLNDVARRVVLEILRPRHALLVGRAAADFLPPTPAAAPHAMGRSVSTDLVTIEATGVPVRVVRCNFIGRGGPRRNPELALLGRLLVEHAAFPGGSAPIAGGLPRARMVVLVEEAGLGVFDKTGWTHVVDGRRTVRGDRVLTFRKGDFVREIHLRGHAFAPDPLYEALAKSEADALHLGLVRFRLFPEKHAVEDVERAVRRALQAS